MFIKRLKSLFRKDHKTIPERDVIDPKNTESIDFWTAGITYDSRLDNLLNCKIKEKVFLIREPGNPSDKNAIHVQTTDKKSLGYVSMNRAAKFAPLIDNNQVGSVGYITSIQADLGNTTYGVKVSLPVSKQAAEMLTRDTLRAIDYVFELSPSQNLYMLLTCSKNTLNEVKDLLEINEIAVTRTGVSFTPSITTGIQYRWYIHLDKECDKEFIGKFLRGRFPVLQEKYDNRLNKDYIKIQEEENQDLTAQGTQYSETISSQAERIHDLEKELQSISKREKNLSNQFEDLLQIFLGNVIFVRNSTHVLKAKVDDYTLALKEIIKINSDPLFEGKKIHTLNKWFEIHFNTGRKDDGRIYFKKEGNNLNILVSFKAKQKKDIEFLKGYE